MKYKGIHAYNKDIAIHRGKVIKIVNLNYPVKKKDKRGSICGRKSVKNEKKRDAPEES